MQKETHALQAVTDKWTAALPDFNILDNHKKTAIFQKDIIHLNTLENTQKELAITTTQLQSDIRNHELTKEKTSTYLKEQTTLLQSAKKNKVSQEKLFQEVAELDVLLKEKKNPLDKKLLEVKELTTQLEQFQQEEKKLKEEQKALKTIIDKRRDWLKEYKHFEQLSDDLPILKLHLQELKTIHEQSEKSKKEEWNLSLIHI